MKKSRPPTMNHSLLTNKGFTLIELLVVIAIISVLASLLMVNFIGLRQRARDAARKTDVRQIQSALEFYRSDNGIYPTTVTCGSSIATGSTTYMEKVSCDPLGGGEIYTYSCTATSGSSCIKYKIYACLENLNDSEKDGADQAGADLCTTVGRVSFTVKSP